MKPNVFSEIGRLQKVLVHSPGKEIDIIVPEGANDLLFEDILFWEKAKDEHSDMCKVLNKYGVETYDTKDLLIEALKVSGKVTVSNFIDELRLIEHLSSKVVKILKNLPPQELGNALVEGIVLEQYLMDEENFYLLKPIPNLIFARDPIIIAFDRVLASSMAEDVRRRESKILIFIFSNHPDFIVDEPIIDLRQISTEGTKLTLEGGDFLVLDEDTVAIAWSKRTSLQSIRIIAEELKKFGVKHLIVAKLPHRTSFIHLDTVFTRINYDECLIYPPLFAPENPNKADIFYFDLSKDIKEKRYDTIFEVLDLIGIPLKAIYCGGKNNLISQKREQWTQGANAFCIAPGIILTYSRNINTIKELSKEGYLCISATEVLSPTFEPNFDQKTAILLKGEELCRARGGPRCLTHPIYRDRRDVSRDRRQK